MQDIALIYLASGLSTRFGTDKLMADLNGRPVMSYGLSAARACPFGLKLGVVNNNALRKQVLVDNGFETLINSEPEKGQGHSLAMGAKYALSKGYKKVIIMLADMPLISSEHIMDLASQSDFVVLSEHDGVKMPPAFISGWALEGLAFASKDEGAKRLFQAEVKALTLQKNAAIDIDTPEDLVKVAASIGNP